MRNNGKIRILLSGLILGAVGAALMILGNPGNMGFCIACFLRDIAGSLGLHQASTVQAFRPEIPGLVLGAMGSAMVCKEWKAKGGSSPALRFMLGMIVMIGALMFLGCPLRMVLRLGAGDGNAIPGLLGFTAGAAIGSFYLKKGFSLKRAYNQTSAEGSFFPILLLTLLMLFLLFPALFIKSTEGPGSQAASWFLALAAGALVGVLCQKSRLCMMGGIRDAILFRDYHLLSGFVAALAAVFLVTMLTGTFHPGFEGQPIAHTAVVWNFLGMVLVGWGSVLLGGCPLRQLILAGEGSSDSAITILGMIFGAAMCHNWNLASSPKGPTFPGKLAVLLCIIVLFIISNCLKAKENLT